MQPQSSVMAVQVRRHLLTGEVELSGTKSIFLLIRIVVKLWPYKCKKTPVQIDPYGKRSLTEDARSNPLRIQKDTYEPIAVSVKMLDTGTLGVSGLLVRLLKSHFAGLT